MISPGKYDQEAQQVLEKTQANGIVLLVIDGDRGSGMSVKSDKELLKRLPNLLRMTAAAIEEPIEEDLKHL